MQKRYLRCFAEFSDGVWVAYCLDLGLGAQGDSLSEAKNKLEAQLRDLSAEEAQILFRQSSPTALWVRYCLIMAVDRIARVFGRVPRGRRERFAEPVPPRFATC